MKSIIQILTPLILILLLSNFSYGQANESENNKPHLSTGMSDTMRTSTTAINYNSKAVIANGQTANSKKKKVKKAFEPIQFNTPPPKNAPYNGYTEKGKPIETDGPGALLLGILAEKTHHSHL